MGTADRHAEQPAYDLTVLGENPLVRVQLWLPAVVFFRIPSHAPPRHSRAQLSPAFLWTLQAARALPAGAIP
ncbi:hypothetical protein GCM10010222_73890 [Streptomyces tanashiensis]|nr:hypothetical protein GCM10010222_73890 [Streptomyces tanashiensis]